MMATLKQLGLTPGKAAMVAVLAVGLGLVWGPQLVGSSKTPQVTKAKKSKAPSSARSSNPTQSKPIVADSRAKPERAIATLTLDEATQYDPFAIPAWSAQAATSLVAADDPSATSGELRERFDTLTSTGVEMILVSDGGKAAQIGGRTLRIGDEIDGFRVVEITDTNVMFEPISPSEGGGRGT